MWENVWVIFRLGVICEMREWRSCRESSCQRRRKVGWQVMPWQCLRLFVFSFLQWEDLSCAKVSIHDRHKFCVHSSHFIALLTWKIQKDSDWLCLPWVPACGLITRHPGVLWCSRQVAGLSILQAPWHSRWLGCHWAQQWWVSAGDKDAPWHISLLRPQRARWRKVIAEEVENWPHMVPKRAAFITGGEGPWWNAWNTQGLHSKTGPRGFHQRKLRDRATHTLLANAK